MATNLEASAAADLRRLVGPLAHDCNNLVTVIGAHAEILLSRLDRDDPLYENADAIRHAVDRTGMLLRQIATVWRAAHPDTPPAPDPGSPMPRGAETILLVENEPPVLALMRDILRIQGYTVLAAHSGDEALQVAERHTGPIDLVLTDVVMPGLTGRAVVERVTMERPGVKAIYVSGYGEDALVEQGLEPDATNFLAKPFSVEGLARTVRAALDASESRGIG